MDREIARRLRWVRMLQETGNAGLVCLRCGVSRPTLRKWARRYQEHGEQGLQSVSRRPHRSPNRKLTDQDRSMILRLRGDGNGARRIQTELRLFEQTEFSLATIHKVLTAANVKPLIKPKRSHVPRRYSRPTPGDRLQMDTMKLAPGVYQYTAVDDCSRFRVLGVHPRRNARNTLLFLDRVTEEMPFPIQRIQTDRGTEFFAEGVQRRLMAAFINSPDSTAFASSERQGRTIATDRFGGILVAAFTERGSNSTANRRVAVHLQLQTFARWLGRQDARRENG